MAPAAAPAPCQRTNCPTLHVCRAELDEDLPAHGQHYCIACARYFISPSALEDHEKTKPHRR